MLRSTALLPHFKAPWLSLSMSTTTTTTLFPNSGNCAMTAMMVANRHLLSLLRLCLTPPDLPKGRQIHAQIITNGLQGDYLLLIRVLGMYVLCRRFTDAEAIFSNVTTKQLPLPWNWLIRGFTMANMYNFAILYYLKMWWCGAFPDKYTFPYVIKSCAALGAFGLGRLVHRTICLMGFDTDLHTGSSLIKLYTENGCIGDARQVFDKMLERDCVLWNVMIDGYARNGDVGNAVALFADMRKLDCMPNFATFACLLSASAAETDLLYGMQLHSLVVKYGLELELAVANTMLAMYSKCQRLTDARRLFSLLPQSGLVSWNGIISGCVQNGFIDEALELLYQMQISGVKPDSVTLASLLPAFTDSQGLKQGKEIHAYIFRNSVCMDVFVVSALIDIYLKCKDVGMAQKVFDLAKTIDVAIGSAMISGYVLNGMSYDAMKMFRYLLQEHLKPNAITVASVLPTCSTMAALELGKELHGYVLKNAYEGRCYVGSALMDMYAKCGRLDLSYYIFANMPDKDAVTWNSMIASFAQNGKPDEALSLFRQMGMEEMMYSNATISCALSACGSLPAIYYGKEIHCFMIKGSMRADVFAESALIDMYGKCGNLELACRVFELMPKKNEVSWNSIIAAYGAHGFVKEAVSLFEQMQEAGYKADHITYLSLISACAHAGHVDEGFRLYHCMTKRCGIAPKMEHYACMVDLYSRAGQLDKAMQFIMDMPFEPDTGIWGAILNACRVHRNVELAEIASRELLNLDPHNSGYYVLMSNINAVAGRWDGVSKVRRLMKDKRVEKVPGYSWIDVNNSSHMFIAADNNHLDSEEIYMYLNSLLLELKDEGYVPRPDLCYPARSDINKHW